MLEITPDMDDGYRGRCYTIALSYRTVYSLCCTFLLLTTVTFTQNPVNDLSLKFMITTDLNEVTEVLAKSINFQFIKPVVRQLTVFVIEAWACNVSGKISFDLYSILVDWPIK